MKTVVDLAQDSEPAAELLASEAHQISLKVDRANGDVYLESSSRLALFEFGKALMLEAQYGEGPAEFYPLGQEGKWLVVNGARLAEGSSRLFVAVLKEQG